MEKPPTSCGKGGFFVSWSKPFKLWNVKPNDAEKNLSAQTLTQIIIYCNGSLIHCSFLKRSHVELTNYFLFKSLQYICPERQSLSSIEISLSIRVMAFAYKAIHSKENWLCPNNPSAKDYCSVLISDHQHICVKVTLGLMLGAKGIVMLVITLLLQLWQHPNAVIVHLRI